MFHAGVDADAVVSCECCVLVDSWTHSGQQFTMNPDNRPPPPPINRMSTSPKQSRSCTECRKIPFIEARLLKIEEDLRIIGNSTRTVIHQPAILENQLLIKQEPFDEIWEEPANVQFIIQEETAKNDQIVEGLALKRELDQNLEVKVILEPVIKVENQEPVEETQNISEEPVQETKKISEAPVEEKKKMSEEETFVENDWSDERLEIHDETIGENENLDEALEDLRRGWNSFKWRSTTK